ncbi:hypothetical protein DY000_02028024 [Brassica cretica]|uniref:UBC core domain-containing protein n=1 Tax=Brassica cretica TaxID=69181 RepID=A0ABQ7EB50_BRACR|nr:hypothetical protein DY000_02028024 [Brassica cretica]
MNGDTEQVQDSKDATVVDRRFSLGEYVFSASEPTGQMRYYQSGGWKLNPNLYERGNICLSLLNTWQGRKSEVWNPKSSSIFQVLLSLQGLVLNAKSYYKSLEKLTAKLFPALSLLGASDQ